MGFSEFVVTDTAVRAKSGGRRAAVAWCRPRVIVARRPDMLVAEYLQHYYDTCHGRSTGLTDPSTWGAGLMQSTLTNKDRVEHFNGDVHGNGLNNR